MAEFAGEFAYIDWLRKATPQDPRVLIGPGDDAAALRLSPHAPCLVTTDMLLEGSCFRLSEAGPRLVGRKAMAVNLSDIAAMAGKPVAAVVSVGLPRQGGRRLAEELYHGLREMADQFKTALAGGDTNSWEGPLVISVTLIGEATNRGPVRRNGARQGDWLLLTGPLGGSILGKHLTFTPPVQEALATSRLYGASRNDRHQRWFGSRRQPPLRRERLWGRVACRKHSDHECCPIHERQPNAAGARAARMVKTSS